MDRELINIKTNVINLITQFAGNANLITIPRVFMDYTEDINSALFLSQLLYWTGRTRNDGWIYKTYIDWETEIGLSKYKVSKASNRLKKMNVLETKVKKINGNSTVHYKVKVDALFNSLMKFLNKGMSNIYTKGSSNFKQSLKTKTTTKTTHIKNVSEKINDKHTLSNTNITDNSMEIGDDRSRNIQEFATDLIDDLISYYGFDELNHSFQIKEIKTFVDSLKKEQKLQYFYNQFNFYKKYKKASGQKVHGYKTFLISGEWRNTNWQKKHMDAAAADPKFSPEDYRPPGPKL